MQWFQRRKCVSSECTDEVEDLYVLPLHACMSVTALIRTVVSGYRRDIPQTCEQAEFSLIRLSTMWRWAQTAAAGYQSGLIPPFNSPASTSTLHLEATRNTLEGYFACEFHLAKFHEIYSRTTWNAAAALDWIPTKQQAVITENESSER